MDLLSIPIIYSKRRTVSVTIKRDGTLVVRAPKFAGERRVRQFLESKRDWIERTLKKAQLRQPARKDFTEGEQFLFLGEYYPLRVMDDYHRHVIFESEFRVSKYFQHKARQLFTDWYKQQAKSLIAERAKHYGNLMGLRYKRISIKNTTTQWGSCSTLGNLNFSYRLVMAPTEIIDYVVVHELAHLTHHNHSQGFWKLVAAYYPSHKQARKWLNENGHFLAV